MGRGADPLQRLVRAQLGRERVVQLCDEANGAAPDLRRKARLRSATGASRRAAAGGTRVCGRGGMQHKAPRVLEASVR